MSKSPFLNWGWSEATPTAQLRRVRALVCACFMVIAVALTFLLRSITWGISLRIGLIGSAFALALFALFHLRRQRFTISLHSLTLAIYLGGINQYVTLAGLQSGAVTWWLIATLMVGLLGGLRAGLFWAGFGLLSGLTLFYLETHGMLVFPNLTPPESRNVQRVMIMVAEFSALAVVMAAYLTQIEGAEQALKLRNEQLQDQVQRAEIAEAEALDAAAAKSRFLANMTHELRTPLNSIIGFTRRVINKLEGRIEPRQMDALQTVADNGEQMLQLVTDLLDLSHLDAGRLELSRGLIDLREMLNVLTPRLRLTAGSCNLQLALDAGMEAEAFTHGDVSQIKRAIETVIGHALQYTPSGTVQVRTRVTDQFWTLVVCCETLQFDDDSVQRIFDRYHHLHSASDRPAEALCR